MIQIILNFILFWWPKNYQDKILIKCKKNNMKNRNYLKRTIHFYIVFNEFHIVLLAVITNWTFKETLKTAFLMLLQIYVLRRLSTKHSPVLRYVLSDLRSLPFRWLTLITSGAFFYGVPQVLMVECCAIPVNSSIDIAD